MLCQRRSPATHSVYQEDLVCSVLVWSMTASHSESPLFTSRGESFSWEALPFLRGRKHINQINWQLTFQPFGSLHNKNMDSQAPTHPPRMRLIDDFFARAAAPPCLPRVRPAPPPRCPDLRVPSRRRRSSGRRRAVRCSRWRPRFAAGRRRPPPPCHHSRSPQPPAACPRAARSRSCLGRWEIQGTQCCVRNFVGEL